MSSHIIKRLYNKLLEEKLNQTSFSSNKDFYESIETISKPIYEERNLEERIKNLEIKLTKVLANAILKHKLKKISKVFSSSLLNSYHLKILSSVEAKLSRRLYENLRLVSIEENIPIVIGEDGISYGPLKKRDIVYISEDFSSLLIKKKLARVLVDEST